MLLMVEINWDKVKAAFERKAIKRSCPACASDEGWGGGTALASLKVVEYERHNGAPTSENDAVLLVPFHCAACGYTTLFDLTVLMGDDLASG